MPNLNPKLTGRQATLILTITAVLFLSYCNYDPQTHEFSYTLSSD